MKRRSPPLRVGRFRFAGREFAVISAPTEEGDLADLNPAERDVVRGVLRGHSNLEIARSRGTSPRTVANQLAAVFRRFGVKSRVELAARLTGTPQSRVES